MYKVSVRSKDGLQIYNAKFEAKADADLWIKKCIGMNAWDFSLIYSIQILDLTTNIENEKFARETEKSRVQTFIKTEHPTAQQIKEMLILLLRDFNKRNL